MIASLPAAAPLTPPDTGASIAAMPAGASSSAMDCAAAGPMVDRSTNTATPGTSAICAAVALTIEGPGRLVMTMDERAAASRVEAAATAPAASSGAIAAGFGSNTVTS